MKPFVINRHGRLVFPANFFGELDFTVPDTLEQFTAVIERTSRRRPRRTPLGGERLLLEPFRAAARSRPDLFWVNRYSMTMFDKRRTRWRDVPRHRDDVFLPVLTRGRTASARWPRSSGRTRSCAADSENRIFALLFDVFRHKLH